MSTFDLPHGVVGFTPILLGGCRCYPGRLEQGEGQRSHRNGSIHSARVVIHYLNVVAEG